VIQQDGAQIAVRFNVGRRECERVPVGLLRFEEPALILEGDPEIILRLDVLRPDP
jgi:hypothetical protein